MKAIRIPRYKLSPDHPESGKARNHEDVARREAILAAAATHCAWCRKPNPTLRCKRCQHAFYCNTMCQREHWDLGTHRPQCLPQSYEGEAAVAFYKHALDKLSSPDTPYEWRRAAVTGPLSYVLFAAAIASHHDAGVNAMMEAGAFEILVARGESPLKMLFNACAATNVLAVRLLLARNVDPNGVCSTLNGECTATPLVAALAATKNQSGATEIASMLLSAGARPFASQSDTLVSGVPLVVATAARNTAAVEILLDAHNVFPDTVSKLPDSQGECITALSVAASCGDTSTMAVLIKHGADPNHSVPKLGAPFMAGCTPPLVWAVTGYSPAAVAALLDAGADPNSCRPSDGSTAIMVAAEHGYDADFRREVDMRVRSGVPKDDAEREARAVVSAHSAARSEIISLIAKHTGTDIFRTDKAGNGALAKCVASSLIGAVHCLVSHGADPAFKNLAGVSPFDIGAAHDIACCFPAMVPILTSSGCDYSHTVGALLIGTIDTMAKTTPPGVRLSQEEFYRVIASNVPMKYIADFNKVLACRI